MLFKIKQYNIRAKLKEVWDEVKNMKAEQKVKLINVRKHNHWKRGKK